MKVGDVLTVRRLKPRIDDAKGKLLQEITYDAPKGEMFVVLLIGVTKRGEVLNVARRMNDLGWTSPEFPPESDSAYSPVEVGKPRSER